MALRIDWDNHEVIEAEDFKPWELADTIEDVREAVDYLSETFGSFPEEIVELLQSLVELEEEIKNGDEY